MLIYLYNIIIGGKVMLLQKRSIPLCIVLSIITCGIYSIYWFI
ncbi:MAG: DUF4234 domain-containing protein, partial [Oscillospiraceae bacterium]